MSYSGFINGWFNELRVVDQAKLAAVPRSGNALRPKLSEVLAERIISTDFFNLVVDLIHELRIRKISFPVDFRCYPQHICNFPDKSAFRLQWNIGFYADDDPSGSQDGMRIGVGIDLNSSMNEQGVDDYADFRTNVLKNKNGFDILIAALGSYFEPDTLPGKRAPSDAVIHHPLGDPDWFFFGKYLKCSSPEDDILLHNVPRLADEIKRVFDMIKKAGFFR
jgi:hypothetical protein